MSGYSRLRLAKPEYEVLSIKLGAESIREIRESFSNCNTEIMTPSSLTSIPKERESVAMVYCKGLLQDSPEP